MNVNVYQIFVSLKSWGLLILLVSVNLYAPMGKMLIGQMGNLCAIAALSKFGTLQNYLALIKMVTHPIITILMKIKALGFQFGQFS